MRCEAGERSKQPALHRKAGGSMKGRGGPSARLAASKAIGQLCGHRKQIAGGAVPLTGTSVPIALIKPDVVINVTKALLCPRTGCRLL